MPPLSRFRTSGRSVPRSGPRRSGILERGRLHALRGPQLARAHAADRRPRASRGVVAVAVFVDRRRAACRGAGRRRGVRRASARVSGPSASALRPQRRCSSVGVSADLASRCGLRVGEDGRLRPPAAGAAASEASRP
jgi:hypothetical protein